MLNKKRLFLLIGIALFLIPFAGKAVKAKPGVIEFTQPDGKVLPIRLYGNEKAHYATNEEGIVLVKNSEGFPELAVDNGNGMPAASGVRADRTLTTSEKAIKFLTRSEYDKTNTERMSQSRMGVKMDADAKYLCKSIFPTIGSPRSIVILVEYQDVKFRDKDPRIVFEDFLNGENYNTNGATGSSRQYFIENSHGLFSPHFDLYGPVTLKNKRSYYGGNDALGDDLHPEQMLVEAVKALDATVDFSIYDSNKDGFVDSVYIIYAGVGEADTYVDDSVWPHSWGLIEAGVTCKADGVTIDKYSCSNELQGSQIDGIGTFTHEFCHVMGFPDLYNTNDGSDYSTPLSWSLMDEGSYNNNSRTPPSLSSFEKYCFGWLTPEEIMKSGSYQLENLQESNKAYILTTDENKDEFFLVENRQQKGWDRYLPHHGMLVWHIDFNQRAWNLNSVNNTKSHQRVRLVRADNKSDGTSLTGDPFPGRNNKTSFTSTTSPKLMSWNNMKLNVTGLTGITEQSGVISFDVTATEDRSGVDIIETDDVKIRIEDGVLYTSEGSHAVYDLSGRMVGILSESSPLALSKGVYLVSGKKVLVR